MHIDSMEKYGKVIVIIFVEFIFEAILWGKKRENFLHIYRLGEKVWKNCNYFRRIYIGSNSMGQTERRFLHFVHIYINWMEK